MASRKHVIDGPCKGMGDALRQLRHEKRMTQQEVGLGAGIKSNAVSAYENGKQDLRLSSLDRVLKAIGVTLYDVARVLGQVPEPPADAANGIVASPLRDRVIEMMLKLYDELAQVKTERDELRRQATELDQR